ncbi:MAG: glycine cleavage system aminomethyltransferase GcvT [Bacteroidota bacterium]|nr:glycine cleavage system aminomethyltransferase GcvT [Bacteroidota bacterium]
MRKTKLYSEHIQLNAKMVDFGGFNMPIQYTGISTEHLNVRNNVGIFDVSHMGEFYVSGNDALGFLNYVCSNNIHKIKIYKAQYNCLINENGGIIDDLIIYRTNEKDYMLVVNAANIDKDWNWLNQQIKKFNCNISNKSDSIGLISVQGPNSLKLINDVFNDNFESIKKFNFKSIIHKNSKVLISNTGYTGSVGYELYVDNKIIIDVWRSLYSKKVKYSLCAVGLGARDTLRIEAGYPLYGNEINDLTTPHEANLMWITDLNKNFIGYKKILESISNSKKKLVGFKMVDRAIPRKDYDIFDVNNKIIGKVTSGTFSPSKKVGIGMAMIDFENFKSKEIYIENRNKFSKAIITKMSI